MRLWAAASSLKTYRREGRGQVPEYRLHGTRYEVAKRVVWIESIHVLSRQPKPWLDSPRYGRKNLLSLDDLVAHTELMRGHDRWDFDHWELRSVQPDEPRFRADAEEVVGAAAEIVRRAQDEFWASLEVSARGSIYMVGEPRVHSRKHGAKNRWTWRWSDHAPQPGVVYDEVAGSAETLFVES